jgi:hypothetical protein
MGIQRLKVGMTDGWIDEQMEIPSHAFTLNVSS